MTEDKDNKVKAKPLLSQLFVPVATALIVGGTAPWWVALFQKDKSAIDNAGEVPSVESIVQANTGSGFNISAGGDVNVSALAEAKSHPSFEGEIGHFEMSQPFTDFIFENQGKIVLIDAYYTPDDSSELTVTNNSFGVDYLHLWHECYENLLSGEDPSSFKCVGTSFSIDRSEAQKDADFTYVRGTFKAQGLFAIRGCDGPYQGSMGCMLRPLNPEDIQ